jgi:alpha-2-macroglobulin-like protein
MKTSIRISIFICLVALLSLTGMAQPLNYGGAKEKVYLHTNHVFFKHGETVFFKLYLVNARMQTPSPLSPVAYVDVINPSGNVVQKLTYPIANGYTEGSFDFNESLPGGIYKLKAYTTWMKNEQDSLFFTKELTLQQVIAPRVLLKLDFPQKGFGPGDEVKADFSMRSLDDEPIRFHNGRFSVALNGKQAQQGNFKTDGSGKTTLRFRLPETLDSDDGLLNIQVSYDGFNEAISRSIPINLKNIDLQLLPEGGALVEGLESMVAFKALNNKGKAADIKGMLTDEKGNTVAVFESYHMGMGAFRFTPQPGMRYKAKIISLANNKQEFLLPAANQKGVVMHLQRNGLQMEAVLASTEAQEVTLTGTSKSNTLYEKRFSLPMGKKNITIPADAFPAGIAQFTLYRADGLPLAERLFFMNPEKELRVRITPDKKQYQPREKVTLNIHTTDEAGKPLPSNLSISVVDDKLWTFADDKQDHILSWLLLSSELKGKVEEPQFYFKKEEPKSIPALDLLMLTHGYRYFDYIEYVKNEKHLKFVPDQSNLVQGVLMNAKGNAVRGMVYLIDPTGATNNAMQQYTGDDGIFVFSNISATKTYYLMAKGRKKEKLHIKVLANGLGYNPQLAKLLKPVDFEPKDFAIIKEKGLFDKQQVADRVEIAKREVITLEERLQMGSQVQSEVVVVGYGAVKRRDMTGASAIVRAEDIRQAPLMNFDNLLAGRVTGVQIATQANPGAGAMIRIRGIGSVNAANNPLFIIDGVPVERLDPALNMNDIEHVEVLKGPQATAFYGARAANGAIAIQSKKYRTQSLGFNLNKTPLWASSSVHVQTPAYSVARRFYAPVYHSMEAPERNDFRETVYWNPVVETGDDGKASISFYNSDATTTFRTIAEGLSAGGRAGRSEITYASQTALSADVKIPPYLTMGDKALLPLVLKNNMDAVFNAQLGVEAPGFLKTGAMEPSITLAPGESRQVLIPAEVIAVGNGVIRFIVNTPFNSETITLPITAGGKGFPVVETLSGNDNQSLGFNINKPIAGTIRSQLKLFNNIEGQLLDGIESMLREPYGCFEQTSSSTYPNVFILKYLKQTGKANPTITEKAMGYIERGYKRLAGYETPVNGFEWFGHTPPHEALTAYGLLEFTDMKPFIKVNEDMMQRTKEFLLNRRDGKGGFLQSRGGYDAFASVPNKIANIYIVYALTQAGIGDEIKKEYEFAVRQAIESKDGYQMAMMALAADNMHNNTDFEKLLTLLDKHYEKNGLASETSVVNSRGISLDVEAQSLYALALLRQKETRLLRVSELLSKILAQKSYYGYGSTQATVMALNALTEFAKKVQVADNPDYPAFTLNGEPLKPGDVDAALLKDGRNSFAAAYTTKKNRIPYSIEVSYQTFTPPTSAIAEINLRTSLANKQTHVGETVRLTVEATNKKDTLQAMAIAKIGIPAGLSLQPWQLKEISEQNKVAYYEIFDNYLVLYWMGFKGGETKTIHLDLKAEVPGTYKGKAATTYLYYMPEHKYWVDGLEAEVLPAEKR